MLKVIGKKGSVKGKMIKSTRAGIFYHPHGDFGIQSTIQRPFPSFCQYNTRPARNVDLRSYGLEAERSAHEKSHLHKVFPAIPFHWACEKLAL